MRAGLSLLLLFCLLMLLAPVHASVETRTLKNGARLVTLTEPGATTVVIEVFVRAGTIDEIKGDAGVTSLVTRVLFADSEGRNRDLIDYELSRHGVALGSWASGDYVELWAAARSESVDEAARTLLMDLFARPTFPDAAVRTAKQEQLAALALSQDNLLADAMMSLRGRIFSTGARGQNPLGTAGSVASLTPAMVRDYYARIFTEPKRTTFVVAGNIKPDEAAIIIESNLGAGGWPPDRSRVRPTPMLTESSVKIAPNLRNRTIARPAPATILTLGYLAPGTEDTAKYASLLLLDAVLAGGKSSRLFALRDRLAPSETPLGYDVRTTVEAGQKQSLWSLYVLGTATSVTETKTRLLTVFTGLADNSKPVTAEEFARAKAYLKGRHKQDRERLRDRAFGAGWSEFIGLGASFDTDFEKKLDGVTLEEVNRLACEVFTGQPAVVSN